MNNNFHFQRKLEDGTQLEIRIRLSDKEFIIDDIGVKAKRKRNFSYLGSVISDSHSYRGLDFKERQQYKLKKFIEVCGIEMLNECLEEAWLQIKPNKLI
ncbi:hypothetical protein [Bacillus sp. T33-2]|uniref:hypothetical protein n=1 Tax=Bacillus sp. T33-2 TaxID=2054168 RepID=UPI000C78AF95|nr:hypothetical protein [Bacillus sp. T33-2]PLR99593.1 hypothetical protein CVD19_00590 [Bacillus sp. T33-2]